MPGYYSEINAPCDAIYEVACAMDNQDVPLEDWPRKIIDALSKAGYAVVPKAIPDSLLGEAAMMPWGVNFRIVPWHEDPSPYVFRKISD